MQNEYNIIIKNQVKKCYIHNHGTVKSHNINKASHLKIN